MPEAENIQKEVEALCRYQSGSTVWKKGWVSVDEPCDICDGLGTIIGNEKVKECPRCYGKGTRTKDYPGPQELIIRVVNVMDGVPYYEDANNYTYTAEELYPTREEAEAALAKKEGES